MLIVQSESVANHSQRVACAPAVSLAERAHQSSPSPRVKLRRDAVLADQQAGTETNLALCWRELVRGVAVVVDGFFSDTRCGLVLAFGRPKVEQLLLGRRLVIVEAMLRGVGQKRIAIELGLAPSTIAFNARLGLEALGVSCRPSRVHPLLMLAATAAHEQDSCVSATVSHIQFDGLELSVIGVQRPDARLRDVLPPAELEAVRCLVEGDFYADIARKRGTSERTIANQLSAVFRRLNVSGRSELVQRLFALAGQTGGPSAGPALEVTLPPPAPELRVRWTPSRSGDARISGVRPLFRLPGPLSASSRR